MWSNGFGNPGPFQNNFNPDSFSQMPFGAPQGQQFFAQQGMMPFGSPTDENVMDGEYQPDRAMNFPNQAAFMQNQNVGAQFSPSPFLTPQSTQQTPLVSPRAPVQLDSKTAELKARLQLLNKNKKKEERANSATPPVVAPKEASAKEAAQENQKRGAEKNIETPHGQDVNELISQYSAPAAPQSAIGTTIKQENKPNNAPLIQAIHANPATPAQSPIPSNKVTKPNNTGKVEKNETIAKLLEGRHTSNGSVSEGEILEDILPDKATAHMQAKEPQNTDKISMREEQFSRTPREDYTVKPSYPRARRDEPRRRSPSPSPKAQFSNGREPRYEQAGLRAERRPHRANSTTFERDEKDHTETERQFRMRRDRNEESSQPQGNGTDARAEPVGQTREQNPPTLHDVLPHDEDLREWLEITGYHNESYRSKILNRRRAIAALDAQRDKLLAEMAAEERGGAPPVVVQQTLPSMLPPPIPNKVGGRLESSSSVPAVEPQSDRVTSNKRPFSEMQGSPNASDADKIPRVEERREKEEGEFEVRRPRSSGGESSRRFSPTRREEHGYSRQRFEGRGRSRERDMSPGRRAYEGRPGPRVRPYESDNFHSRDSYNDRRSSDWNRPGYKAKPYESNFRGSGRGRGRGRGEYRDRDNQSGSQDKNDSPYGSQIASKRPFKDAKGFDQGGRGDTRYFIVKSFNEENVLKCIQDSVWTTQLQNGPIFKEAFETCRNVILVFSINKSRAFQGYARMESLPGSVEVPEWQRAITWESAGAFRVRWLVICATRFHRVGHLKNPFNENQAVLIGKDGQEIEESCGAALIELIDNEADLALRNGWVKSEEDWMDQY